MHFIRQLKKRNPLLFWFGFFNILVGIACLALMPKDDIRILGVSRWLKPMKFYFAVGIMICTMGWLLHYLDNPKRVSQFSLILFVTMFFENGLILLQAIRGTTSHFNIKTTFDSMVFNLMGIFILIFIITCIRICIAFFKQKHFSIPDSYAWGIRLGLLLFVIFSLEGGIMLSILKHTVGGNDGGKGLPVVNWSKQHGDLRIAHFLGIHALQLLPLAGNFIFKKRQGIIMFAVAYAALVIFLLVNALLGNPLFPQ